jgi:hypothetical protein
MTTIFLDQYEGQTLAEILVMARTHRIDSLVLAMEQALEEKVAANGLGGLSEAEWTVLAIEGLEREVNNGGFHQFFGNSSQVYTAGIGDALDRIGCPQNALLARKAVGYLGISGLIDEDSVNTALDAGDERLADQLNELDKTYYQLEEPIAEMLFKFVIANRLAVTLHE